MYRYTYRTTRVGCRCENVVFVYFCDAPRPERCSLVQTGVALPCIGLFQRGFHRRGFSEGIAKLIDTFFPLVAT